MKSIKFLIATTLLLIFSCSNLGEQSQNDLKLNRSGNAFKIVLDQVLEEDKDFAEIVSKAEQRNSYTDQISFNWKRGSEHGPDEFINTYYRNVSQQIGMIKDSTDRQALANMQERNEADFLSQMEEQIALNKALFELEMEVEQKIKKLKIKKTLAYVKEYQKQQIFDTDELSKELQEMKTLLAELEALE